MKRRQIVLLLMMALAVLLYWMPKADAESGFFGSNCTTSGCHATSPSTCDGCHAHGVHSSSSKSNVNIAGTINKSTYAPGETVSVTIDGGYRTGWVRAVLYDQNMNELARSTGTSSGGKGGGPAFPLTLTAPAPTAAGTYTWSVAWYGHKYDKSGAFFQTTCSATVTTNCWKPAANPNHGEEIRSIAAFTVSAPPGDTTAPVVTGFSIPAAASSLTVAITTLTATDAVGVTGYLVNESSTKPTASAGGWSASKPTSYTFGSEGTKTLYAWAKDAAGNVSNSLSANVTVTISTADTIAPAITVFEVPAVIYSLKAPITALEATDNVGVAGYIVKKSPSKPSVTDAGWRSTPPTSVTISDAGAKTLYAWAKDAAGNISDMASMTVVCRLADPGIIPVPASQEIFAYSAVPFPAEKGNLAKAKPLGIGALAEWGSLDLQASIGPFSGPVDVYITMYAPEAAGSWEPLAVYYLRPDNSFAVFTTATEPWQQGVTDINEHIVNIPAGELLSGPYILVMTVTPAGSQANYYKWSTSFIVP